LADLGYSNNEIAAIVVDKSFHKELKELFEKNHKCFWFKK